MTQKKIRALLEEWFRNDLMGMPGDEDGGGSALLLSRSWVFIRLRQDYLYMSLEVRCLNGQKFS